MRKPEEIIINGKTLEEILENHLHWLREDVDGWQSMRAALSSADLRSADLSSADLRSAYLRYADLRSADLSSADLSYANLRYANLSSADLRYANLSSADLSSADLSYANLRYANLSSADLRYANLSYADLSYANLSSADLSYANLSYADLSYANLSSADLPYIPMACPEEGDFIGWKKCNGCRTYNEFIVKLHIPEDAKRSSATGRKCRCDKAEVVAIYRLNGEDASNEIAYSSRVPSFTYKVGETVSVDNFDDNRYNECAPGIHFFLNRKEAINY